VVIVLKMYKSGDCNDYKVGTMIRYLLGKLLKVGMMRTILVQELH
jgi:hypothetical protein